MGLMILGVLAYLITGSIEQASLITITFHAIQVVLYWAHERAWNRIAWGVGSVASRKPFYASLIALILTFAAAVCF